MSGGKETTKYTFMVETQKKQPTAAEDKRTSVNSEDVALAFSEMLDPEANVKPGPRPAQNDVFEPRERKSVEPAAAQKEVIEVVDPNTLPPTYSMVSYCPFVGNCCFLPMNLLSLGIGTCTNENCTTAITRTRAIWEDRIRVNIDCDVSQGKPQVRTTIERPKAQPEIMGPQFGRAFRGLPPAMATATLYTPESKEKMYRAEPVPAPYRNPVPISDPVQEEEYTQAAWVSKPEAPITAPEPNTNNRREDDVRYAERRNREPSLLFSKHKVVTDVNIELLRKESQTRNMPESATNLAGGISGIKDFIDARSKMRVLNQDDVMDFIDYFSKKDGCKYIGMLEQIFIEYFEKTKTDIVFAENDIPDIKAIADRARARISEIFKIIQVEEEKQLQDYDFPAVLERDCRAFEIDYLPKVMLIGKLHNYGVKMILYWIKLLETKKKEILPERVFDIGTELMADVMVICYGLFTKIADFLVVLAEHPTEKQVQTYTLDYFIRAFRNLVDCICDEIGAIGESCGQVMIRIPNITRQSVISTMTSLYKQVNFAHLSIARAMEALAPVLHLYYIRYFVLGPRGLKGHKVKSPHLHKNHKKKRSKPSQ